MNTMTKSQLHHIFIEIHDSWGQHGSFLTAFAETYINADYANELLLRQAAQTLVEKYNLEKYLDNYKGE